MRRLLPVLLLAACAAPAPRVTTAGALPKPAYAVEGDSPAAAEVQRQLIARGWYAADAPTILHIGHASAPRATTSCAEPDSAAASGCKTWHDAPSIGWHPFAPAQRQHLSIAIESAGEAATPARIDAVQPGNPGLPALVTAALARLPG